MQSGFRVDLQALRGVAVLLVLFYHADMLLPGGYLGVDVFFVISGYLITGLVCRALERGEFSFGEFYYRRAKRLLPAAYVTLLVTGLLAPVILNDAELRDFFAQLIGALTFSSNVVLFLQSGYFEGAADLKPLLHIWSLSIEEQYYFLLPAACGLGPFAAAVQVACDQPRGRAECGRVLRADQLQAHRNLLSAADPGVGAWARLDPGLDAAHFGGAWRVEPAPFLASDGAAVFGAAVSFTRSAPGLERGAGVPCHRDADCSQAPGRGQVRPCARPRSCWRYLVLAVSRALASLRIPQERHRFVAWAVGAVCRAGTERCSWVLPVSLRRAPHSLDAA